MSPGPRGWLALAAIAAAIGALGCYSPTVPSGGYRCGADQACPSGLSCICGACVSGPEAAACSFTLAIAPGGCADPSDSDTLCVTEGQPFPATVTAFSDTARSVPSTFRGTASFDSTWGNARPTLPFSFQNGAAQLSLTLDRATPKHKTYVTVINGSATGASGTGIFVDAPAFTVEPNAVLLPPFGWAGHDVALPAIDRAADGSYTMYYAGFSDTGLISIGSATSPDGNAWTPATQPIVNPPAGMIYYSPSVLHTPAGIRVFLSANTPTMGGLGTSHLMSTLSTDGGKSFAAPASAGNPCPMCQTGTDLPWLLRSPSVPDEWLLVFTSVFGARKLPSIGIARTVDGGRNWTADQVATPGSALGPAADNAFAARVLYDPGSALYRMWYSQIPGGLDPCVMQVSYATSSDGQFWTGTRANVPPLQVSQVPWARSIPPSLGVAVGLLPGAIEPPERSSPSPHYTLWYSLFARVGLSCLPVGIGRATRP